MKRMITSLTICLWLVAGSTSGQPPTTIDNADVNIVFDHTKGGIHALTYKSGSSQNLLDPQYNNAGLGKLGGLGDPGQDETGSVVTGWDVQSNSAYFEYANPLYGTKRLDLSWSAANGIEIVMTFNFDNADAERETRGVWEPGGNDGDNNDYITVLKADESQQTFNYDYPGPWTLIWEGDAYGTKVWDADYDEYIGYRSECHLFTRFAEGAAADGPYHRLERGGVYVLAFAVKHSIAFDAWFHSFANTGLPCDCCNGDGRRGNVDNLLEGEFEITVADLTHLVGYLFDAGPAPPCAAEGNVDGTFDGSFPITVPDLTYLVAYLFSGGPEPPLCP